MLEYFLLVSSAFLIIALALRSLRQTRGTSLLAWHALVFVLTFTPAALFYKEINDSSQLSISRVDPFVVSRFINCVLLANTVIIGCLLVIRRKINEQRRSKLECTYLYQSPPRIYWIGIIVVVIGTIVFITSQRVATILDIGTRGLGDYSTYYAIRYELSQITTSTLDQYLYVVPIGIILPLLTLYSLYHFILSRRKSWLFLWVGLVLTWLLLSILYYAKQPAMVVILSNVMLLALVGPSGNTGDKRYSSKWLVIGGSCILLTAFLIYKILGVTEDIVTTLQLLGERFLTIPAMTTYNHLYVFPELNSHTYYQGSTALNILLAGGQSSLDGSYPSQYIASSILTGIAYNMNTAFVGSGWAAMGYVGVVQGAVLIFGAFMLLDSFFVKNEKHSSLIILAAFFVGRIDNIQNVDLINMFIRGGIVLVPLFMILLTRQEHYRRSGLQTSVYPL